MGTLSRICCFFVQVLHNFIKQLRQLLSGGLKFLKTESFNNNQHKARFQNTENLTLNSFLQITNNISLLYLYYTYKKNAHCSLSQCILYFSSMYMYSLLTRYTNHFVYMIFYISSTYMLAFRLKYVYN